MNQKLHDLLSRLTGHIATGPLSEDKNLQSLHHSLSKSLLPEDVLQLKSNTFQFESADFLSPSRVPAEISRALEGILEQQASPTADLPAYRVFLREVGIRSVQIPGAVPSWAAGSAVDHTLGPFTSIDGRLHWYDFYQIQRLVTLYIGTLNDPALLFSVDVGLHLFTPGRPLSAKPATQYKLAAGSIWISAQILTKNAPPGLYVGLLIQRGTVRLSSVPQIVNGKLSVDASATITVKLQLQQPVAVSDAISPYGTDARASTLTLPDHFAFEVKALTPALLSVGSADWNVYGDAAHFDWDKSQAPYYNPFLRKVVIPFSCTSSVFTVQSSTSPFFKLAASAPIVASAWTISAAAIDIIHPTAAAGIGGMMIACKSGLTSSWPGLEAGNLRLQSPLIALEPGHISIGDLAAGNNFCNESLRLWQDAHDPYGRTLKLQYSTAAPLFLESVASGEEALATVVAADLRIDRPVNSSGDAFPVRAKNATLVIAATKAARSIFLFDEKMYFEQIDLTKKLLVFPPPQSLALHNALFKVTPVSGVALLGTLSEDFSKITSGWIFLSFGVYTYLPTLPDPYAANLSLLERSRDNVQGGKGPGAPWMLLICQLKWKPRKRVGDHLEVSFHFAPLPQQLATGLAATANVQQQSSSQHDIVASFLTMPAGQQGAISALIAGNADQPLAGKAQVASTFSTTVESVRGNYLPDYGKLWDEVASLPRDTFALLDVSTNADLLGVSFAASSLGVRQGSGFPLSVREMNVVSEGRDVRFFTVPQISWEPVLNLTPPQISGDPDQGPNYYPNDGGPTRIVNNSTHHVAIAPIPLTDFLVEKYKHDDTFAARAIFTLPFGLRAEAVLRKTYQSDQGSRPGANLLYERKTFADGVKGAAQLELDGGESYIAGESNSFVGGTVQLNNVLNSAGSPTGNSTLGSSVTRIFNGEFLPKSADPLQRGVPLTRIGLSGYGATTFSNWLNPHAALAETSQARFDVIVGRCAHEVIQVKSILYPWGIQVVRTITLFRTASGYPYRWDSGWRAQSAGKFDFTYYVGVKGSGGQLTSERRDGQYEIHPGIVKALWNVQHIQETAEILPFFGSMTVAAGDPYVDENGEEQTAPAAGISFDYYLQPVFFDADVEVEDPISGFKLSTLEQVARKISASKHVLGFVQIAPTGMPLTTQAFHDLIQRQGNIGGPLDAVLDIHGSGQHFRTRGFDFNNSVGSDSVSPIFVAAVRGTTILPKDGAWSLVQHQNGTGNVSPTTPAVSVPLIRIGQLIPQPDGNPLIVPDPFSQLVRIAETGELLRQPQSSTINYGFLHSTDTQKALFLTPSYARGVQHLLSKTPPLFADAFRIVNSRGIFPNIGNAVTGFGDAINLGATGGAFDVNSLTDAGKQVFEVMRINAPLAGGISQGYKLLKKVPTFDLPSGSWNLVDIKGAFKIYIEYKADSPGALDYDIDSLAANVEDTWKSHMQNVALVVDLGPIKRLMTIKGAWDAKKGADAQYGGNGAEAFPKLEFAPELQPIIDILQILQELETGNYKDAIQQGVRLAMSNKAGSWEYKFEASKEIPVIHFPEPDLGPTAPLKLDAGIKLGAYFNAALKVGADPKQLLPSAGGYLGFTGRLSVMCLSLAAATIYAVGQADLDIGADTATGPSLRMKFGFGAQIVVGLPVVGNVSILYMVGAEIYLDSHTIQISASMLYQGQADLLDGLVCITITIEAKGTISRSGDRTDLAVQVTFAIDISIFLVIDIDFSTSWQEQRQIA